MANIAFSVEHLNFITKPIEFADEFDDYEDHFTNAVINYKNFLNYNNDVIVRILYIRNLTRSNKFSKFKVKPFYKYFEKVNNYFETLKCHVEFIILKYMFINGLLNESSNFRNNIKANRGLPTQYKKLELLFKELDPRDAYQISKIIFNDIYTLMEYVEFDELFSNISDYCECIINLLILIRNSGCNNSNVELSYNLTYFLMINPDFSIKKINELKGDDPTKTRYFLNMEFLSKGAKIDRFYYYNILQLTSYDFKNNLFVENEIMFMLDLVVKSILKKLSGISCYLFRRHSGDVLEFILCFHSESYSQPYCNIMPENQHLYVGNLIKKIRNDFTYPKIKSPLEWYCMHASTCCIYYRCHDTCNICYYLTKLKLNITVRYFQNGILYYQNFCTINGLSYQHFDCYDCHYISKYSNEDFCPIHDPKYDVTEEYSKYGDKIINFNIKSKNYKKSKSRHIDKSRSKLRRKNKFKIKDEFRRLKY